MEEQTDPRETISNYLLFLSNSSLLADVDTIKELTDIFVLHMAFLSPKKGGKLSMQELEIHSKE